MGELGLPVILLAVIWGVFNPILKAIEIKRDKMLDREPVYKLRQRWFMIYDDWLILAVFCTGFISIISLMIIVLSGFFTMPDQDFQNISDTIFVTVGIVMLILSLLTLAADIANFFLICRTVRRDTDKKPL
jgi:hypothetical protein